jgi:hypothetical protein
MGAFSQFAMERLRSTQMVGCGEVGFAQRVGARFLEHPFRHRRAGEAERRHVEREQAEAVSVRRTAQVGVGTVVVGVTEVVDAVRQRLGRGLRAAALRQMAVLRRDVVHRPEPQKPLRRGDVLQDQCEALCFARRISPLQEW